MLQTNNSGMCSQCLSHTGPCPCSRHMQLPCPHCSGSRLLCREPSAAGPGLLAPSRSKPLRFRHLGSPQRHRLIWACVLCPSQIRAAQVMRCLASMVAATYRLPAARLSGCTTSAPSQVDVDCPEPQEVLVSKEACLQFCRYCLSGAAIAPFWLQLPVTKGGWSAAGYLCIVLCSVHGLGGVLGQGWLSEWQISHSLVCQPKLFHSGSTWGIQARSLL